MARGEAAHEAEVARRTAALGASTVSTLIYTSGTTGTPKGVMLTQRNLAFIAEKIQELVPIGAGDRLISYLPLSHIAEQVVSHLLSIATGATVYFAESLEKMPENLREVRPQFFLGVPRVWEKIQAGIQAAGAQASPLRRRIAAWARGVGRAAVEADMAGRPRPWSYALANRLVFSKVRARLGLDAARMLCVSSAPIAKETLDFFGSLGMPIMEAYGMSECTGPTTMSLPERYQLGRAGYAIPGTELTLAEDGEVLMRGPHVFLGYFKNEEATRETLDADGWLHSGDVGEIDQRRLPAHHRPQEGADHHRRREEHRPAAPRGPAQADRRGVAGGRDRGPPAVRGGAADARSRPPGGRGGARPAAPRARRKRPPATRSSRPTSRSRSRRSTRASPATRRSRRSRSSRASCRSTRASSRRR